MKLIKSLLACAAASALALVFVTATPRPAFADTTGSDNQYVDGNWFQISADAGTPYVEGCPVNLALETQITAYQAAVTSGDLAAQEHFAIRSWVKSLNADAEGEVAFDAGNYAIAGKDFRRAIKLAKRAQLPGAGLGEVTAGSSVSEGASAQALAEADLAKVEAKLGQ